MAQRMDVRTGMVVKSRDGHQVGRVIGLTDDAFLVEKGVFYARDYSIPFRSVQTIEGDDILLSLDKDQLHKASMGEALDASHRLDLEAGSLSAARIDSSRFFHGDKREERHEREREENARPIGFDVDSPSRY